MGKSGCGIQTEAHVDANYASAAEEPEGQPNVEFVFDDNGDERRTVFTGSPFGIGFMKKTPIIVDTVEAHSHGNDVGVKIGWRLVKVGGTDISNMQYMDAYAVIVASMASLP